MRYFIMTPGKAVRFMTLRREDVEPTLDGYIEEKGVGAQLPPERVKALRAKLLSLKEDFPAELRGKDSAGSQYEALGCEVIHSILPYDLQMLSDPGFWIWLAVTQLSDIVEWRHGGTGRLANLANYGIGNRVENLFFRMWLRAELVKDHTSSDPYWLAKRGQQDFWRSHVLRVNYANVRALTKALVLFQYPGSEKATLPTAGIRELAKRLKRLHANVVYEFLTPPQIELILVEQSADLSMEAGH